MTVSKTPTCFVIMAIGDQPDGTTQATLRARYDSLIKEAVTAARPNISVKRADDSHAGGSITDEILEDILISDYVIAEISQPNPNVFYELGLRHAARPSGTILLRLKSSPAPPFDLSVLRYLAYEDTAAGLKDLRETLRKRFDYIDANPERPDNQFQQVAARVEHEFPTYKASPYKKHEHDAEMLAKLFSSPRIAEMLVAAGTGKNVDKESMLRAFAEDPQALASLLTFAITQGGINLDELFSKSEPTGDGRGT